MYLTHDKLVHSLSPHEVEDLMRKGTAVRPNDVLQKVVSQLKPEVKKIVEIGTWKGLSALVMASCENVEKLWTFDIVPQKNQWLWEKFGVADKITYSIKKSSEEIYAEIEKLDFDFAYIDGSHTTEAETRDFMFMKTKCKRIVADDTDDSRVFGIFSPYGAQRISKRFALWNEDGDYSIVPVLKSQIEWDEPYGKLDFRHLEGL